ncbi:protein elav-like [Dreissena polymorpha]|nr:protein elav-like [Dreissena polymorpha]
MAREDATIGYQSSFGSGFTSPSTGGYQSGMTSPEPSYAGSLTDIPQGPGPFSIFVHNIGEDVEDRELWALFYPSGTVEKCTVMMDTDLMVCKGFDFVDTVHVMEASNAIQNLNG